MAFLSKTSPLPMRVRREWTKRALDAAASILGLLALSPAFAIIAVAIVMEDGGPAIYRQTRVGRDGRRFKINKFRSMSASASGATLTVAGDPRITRVGNVLRRYKFDELPQLWNVLVGDMSLVGPRPETPDLIAHYSPAQRALMLSIKPGVTDWASLLLRNESDLLASAAEPERFYRECLMPVKHDLCALYARETSVGTDLRIILATVWAIACFGARNPWIDRAVAAVADPIKLRLVESDARK